MMEMENLKYNADLDNEAKHIARLLDDNADRLSLRTLKQLESSRARALQAYAQQVEVKTNRNGTISYLFGWTGQHRMASVGLLIGAVLVGFILMQTFKQSEPSDAFLLSEDLPPEAFVDRGFEPSLNIKQAKI
jgi:ABC-type phosphate/phosphonate transport system permease subunit